MLASIGAWCIAGLALFITYLIYFFILKPLISMKFYKDQGLKMPFFPFLGIVKGCIEAQATTGSFYGHWIRLIQNNPATRVIGGNSLDQPQLILVDPKLIKEFYKKQENYIKHPKHTDLMSILHENGLIISEGELWKRHRKLIASAFQYDLLRDMVPGVVRIVDKFLEDLKKNDLSRVKINQEAEIIAGEVIGIFFFGENFSDHRIHGKPVVNFLANLLTNIGSQNHALLYLFFGIKPVKWGMLSKYREILKDAKEFQSFAADIIEKRKQEFQAKDIVARPKSKALADILLSQQGKGSEQPLTTQEIVNEFITFVGAGSNTTGGAVSRAMYYLSQNPQYKENLMEEVNKHFADPSKVTLDTLNQMDFMTAFIKETLRFSPPVIGVLPREAIRDHTLGDLKIRKGTAVNIGALLNNFSPVYHDDVDRFYPERWLTDSKTKESITQDTFVFIPFSSGARNCIGQHLAMNEVRVILSLFLKKYDFEVDPEYQHQMTQRVVYEPRNVMNIKLISKA